MKRKTGLICFILAACLLGNSPGHVYATMSDQTEEIKEEGTQGSGEDDSVEVEEPAESSTTGGQSSDAGSGGSNGTGNAGSQQSTSSGGSTSVTSKNLQEQKGKLSSAEKEKEALQSGLSDIKAIKEKLEKSRSDLKSYVTELDSSLAEIENKLQQINTLIEEKEEEIEETKENLKVIKEEEKKQYAAMESRVKFMYERGSNVYLEVLFSSKSFGDLLSKAKYIEKLAAYDKELLINYQKTRKKIASLEEELKSEQEVLEAAKENAEQEQKNVEELITTKQQQIKEYDSDISEQEARIKEYEASIAEQDATIASLEAAVEAEMKRLDSLGQNSNVKYDGGMFAWPAPAYTRISSDYGNRMHPTLGVEKFHNGLDMAAPSGSDILAAYGGTVVAAAYNASMGNYIMINHGDGLYTIYMHCSALYVSVGATVSRGEKIAAVGSTGRSTGPHLHFSVRLNGNYVNPRNYL
ncbi:MAG: peptidoglycan DD-metalloendopeptidase family protein [Lachnospiraceae bacterium]|nr:peptidoglycan DD-metalloendopeptidase family protein [Lachnospiraceae bacterium]